MKSYNFAEEIEIEAGGRDQIEKVVIGQKNGFRRGEPKPYERGKLMSWDEARPILDYSYREEYGGFDVHTVYVWTYTSVIFVVQYDGLVTLGSVPRMPADVDPCEFGGV